MSIGLVVRKLYRKRIFRVLIIVFIILTVGISWQDNMSFSENKKYDPPGQLIEVNNHKIHIYAEGKGSPSVVFTTGSGTPCAYTDYFLIQHEISKTTRAISYDRPGFGWSDSYKIPSTIDAQVNELHELLRKAGEEPPYILVGHSLSSLEVIHYAQKFPEEVSGIVLIDGGNPIFYANYSEPTALALNRIFKVIRVTGLARALGTIGVFPPLLGEDQRHKLLPREVQQVDRVMFYNKLGQETSRNALRNLNENAETVVEGGKLGDIPLIVLTAGESANEWKESQIQLMSWSNNSIHEEIVGASHYIHWSNPDIVVERIQELINSFKAKSLNIDGK